MGREEVKSAAQWSVIAALVLTALKLVVGVMTNSLGILSEAMHSGMDFIAAGITLVAVRKASKEPDSEHQYGHGKIENFSALIETIILWITVVWILFEAVRRIETAEWAEASLLGIAVMVISIIIDYERSRMLFRTAKKHGSQALEADALHFQTDMISSIVVLIGLGFVWFGLPIADPIAAIGVAIVIFAVSYRLGRRALDALLDSAPQELRDEVDKRCARIEGVIDCKRVRTRLSGPELFVDIVVTVEKETTVDRAHEIADSIEQSLVDLAHQVDVVVHIEPNETDISQSSNVDIYRVIQELAKKEPDIVGLHNVRIQMLSGKSNITADVEMKPCITLDDAHDVSERMEHLIREKVSDVASIFLHLEPMKSDIVAIDITSDQSELLDSIKDTIEGSIKVQDCHNMALRQDSSGITLLLDARVKGSLSLSESHGIAEQVEQLVKERYSEITRVIVHIEPL
ncbi:MAG: cation-efflux pump [Candidatus Thorarchaeota archaeon]